jgi:hypothetical protein
MFPHNDAAFQHIESEKYWLEKYIASLFKTAGEYDRTITREKMPCEIKKKVDKLYQSIIVF